MCFLGSTYKDLYFTSYSRLVKTDKRFPNYSLKGAIYSSLINYLKPCLLILNSFIQSSTTFAFKPTELAKNPPENVYFHITILVNGSVQLVARNRECQKGVNNVLWVVWSCIKMHATHEIMNYASRLTIRATSCTLRGDK